MKVKQLIIRPNLVPYVYEMLILLLTLTLTSRTTRKEFNQRDWSLLTTFSENLVQAWQLFPSPLPRFTNRAHTNPYGLVWPPVLP